MDKLKNNNVKITFLGTGTSQGVPVITCECETCKSESAKDKRLRSSVSIEIAKTSIIIDAGPDFRQQILRENIQKLEGILLTHEHKDHIGGLDDIRAFNYKYKKASDIYAEKRVLDNLKNHEFAYVFAKNKYPGIPEMNLIEINKNPFEINGIKIIPIRGLHYKLPVLGFRIKDFTYITDMNFISNTELEKIKGSKTFVINALRKENHISHFTLSEALKIIEKVNPKKAYLTHISHLMGLHSEVEKILPKNVFLAYDGLKLKL